ncbi:hypothetical protein [Prevotella sp. OH937_COT-195]|uniref:hypothetical protein n=1 Tax=Prevotella sp. OH937_COT-195 TaxID=2491051 RepID=UPI000F654DCF|nr:hypothetical protein [Prevotella sp. OH937_COT-195]RRD02808.1 hypothetical protein EII32_02025 [Prevotella sp. OH937_COT-195]
MKRLLFFFAFIVTSTAMNAQNVLGFNFGMTVEEASEVEIECDSIIIDEEANSLLITNVERNGTDYDLMIVQFDDEGRLSTITLGVEVKDLAEAAAMQKRIISGGNIIENDDDNELAGAKIYIVDETKNGEPDYIISIMRDEEDRTLSVVATYPRDWE